jgi:hypothetical protein
VRREVDNTIKEVACPALGGSGRALHAAQATEMIMISLSHSHYFDTVKIFLTSAAFAPIVILTL